MSDYSYPITKEGGSVAKRLEVLICNLEAPGSSLLSEDHLHLFMVDLCSNPRPRLKIASWSASHQFMVKKCLFQFIIFVSQIYSVPN